MTFFRWVLELQRTHELYAHDLEVLHDVILRQLTDYGPRDQV
jgi:hypothetical protein